MAFDVIRNEWISGTERHKEFICDTDADLVNLPVCAPGSTALSCSSGKVYIVNASGQWVEFGAGV